MHLGTVATHTAPSAWQGKTHPHATQHHTLCSTKQSGHVAQSRLCTHKPREGCSGRTQR